jgi:hypothetical protein
MLKWMGHVLGFSSLWDDLGLWTVGGDYIGTNALAEYRTLTGNPAETSVPNTHNKWDEWTFGKELMSDTFESTGPYPLSRLTIGAMQDLGYTVNYAAADPYALAHAPLPPDDHADGLDDPMLPLGQLATPGGASGQIETEHDQDWFQLQVTAGHYYSVDVLGEFGSDPALWIRDSAGSIVDVIDEYWEPWWHWESGGFTASGTGS